LVAAILLVVNAAVSALAMVTGLSRAPVGVLGDLMLVEVGLLAILGGFLEFSRSKGVFEFRRLAFGEEEEFSSGKHTEASRSAVTFFSAALLLFSLLIVLALLE
jgi:hypothetical protein